MYVRRHPSLWLWMHRRWRPRETPAADVVGIEGAEADA
jgi:lauroyl/myristoyl acyltransferase